MSPAGGPAGPDAVAAFYDRHPYPPPREVRVLPRKDHTPDLRWKAGRQSDWPGRPLHVWIPGGGTVLPLYLHLMFPGAHLTVTDISGASLALARQLLAQAPPERGKAEFRQESLLDHPAEAAFDYVVAGGVVHHLPDPAAGWTRLRDTLRPRGVLEAMVYNRHHRAFYRSFRSALQLLYPEWPDVSAGEMDTAFRALRRSASPAARAYADEALQLLQRDAGALLDAYAHPVEHDFNLEELHDGLHRAGLAFRGWVAPERWNLEPRLADPGLRDRWQRLPAPDRDRLAWLWDYDCSPPFHFFAGRSDAPAGDPPPRDSAALAGRQLHLVGELWHVAVDGTTAHVTARPFDPAVYPPALGEALKYFRRPQPAEAVLADPHGAACFRRLADLPASPLAFE